ncbi:hypothetical protein [Crocosphaera watsonii]|nr:hypothetical protein [Crocosphaera watsonii]CCQ56457.1 hypothetical protein CWATWH0005_5895 [Crocosphaera watsonii WH 0005]
MPKQSTKEQDSYDTFIPSLKEAFSSEFDPIPETVEETINPAPISSISPSQTQRYHQNEAIEPITNPVSIVPLTAHQSSHLPASPESLTYQELKDFIKLHNLQTMVMNIYGKPYNRCKKKELVQALKA